jgi:hypothetical protein
MENIFPRTRSAFTCIVKCVLNMNIQCAYGNSRRTGRTSGTGWKEFRPAGLEDGAVDQLGQFQQRVLEIDQLSQGLLKQITGRGMFAFGTHRKLTKICKESRRHYLIPSKSEPAKLKY